MTIEDVLFLDSYIANNYDEMPCSKQEIFPIDLGSTNHHIGRVKLRIMPVLNSYVDDDGYYITAHPSDVGNITYQVTPDAAQILTDLGYGDRDDLPWGLIHPLRSADLIYTNGQGVKDELDGVPDLDPTKLEQLSSDEVEELLTYLESRKDVSEDVYNHLYEIINEETREDKEILADAISKRFPNKEVNVLIGNKEGSLTVYVFLESDIYHKLHSAGDMRVDEWIVDYVSSEHEYSYSSMAELYETKPDIIRAISEVRKEITIDISFYGISDVDDEIDHNGYMI